MKRLRNLRIRRLRLQKRYTKGTNYEVALKYCASTVYEAKLMIKISLKVHVHRLLVNVT